MAVISYIIWVDTYIEKEKINKYLKEFESLGYYKNKFFRNIEAAIEQIKNIEFEETIIIINEKIYINFIEYFQKNIKEISIIPQITIFSDNKDEFIQKNKEYKNIIDHPFYNSGGIKTNFEEIKKMIINNGDKKKVLNRNDEGNLTFEYINSKEKLLLPMLYKSLMEVTDNDNIEDFTQFLYDNYGSKNPEIGKLLNFVKNISDIPNELLSKYYARIYTDENSGFCYNLNKDLRENKKECYLSFIKVLYEGVKLQSLSPTTDTKLFRGSKLLNSEIEKIKKYLKQKIEGLPGAIVFSKTFLSFSKDMGVAQKFLEKNYENKLSNVLFILEKDNNMDSSISSHADIEKLSMFPEEREVLFFPFSSFEIKNIKEVHNNNIDYEIELLYLGKYLKEFKKDKKLIEKENIIPDSEFKKQIVQFGLIKQENVEKSKNIRQLINKYEQYKDNIIKKKKKKLI